MAKETIIDKIEGGKVWGYVAMGAGLLAVVGIVIAVKETMDAKKVASVKDDVKKEAETVVAENGGNGVAENGEATSGCGGCSSNAEGGWKLPTLASKYKTESFSGARGSDIWKQPRGGGERKWYCDGKLMAADEYCHHLKELTWED